MPSAIEEQIICVLESDSSSLSFRWRHLQDQGCVRLAKLLMQYYPVHQIEEIDISGNDIGDEGIRVLCDTLSFDSKCKVLSLNCNSYREEGMTHIATLLRANSTLTKLDISGSRSRDEGLEEVALCLCDHHVLKELKVSRSSLGAGIGDSGANALKTMLQCNNSLTNLSLWGSRLGDEGVKQLSQGIAANSTLIKLDLGKPFIVTSALFFVFLGH